MGSSRFEFVYIILLILQNVSENSSLKTMIIVYNLRILNLCIIQFFYLILTLSIQYEQSTPGLVCFVKYSRYFRCEYSFKSTVQRQYIHIPKLAQEPGKKVIINFKQKNYIRLRVKKLGGVIIFNDLLINYELKSSLIRQKQLSQSQGIKLICLLILHLTYRGIGLLSVDI
ncbi:hypothetical protein FGO68_gene7562 [Halteria grandinella]|uniref:Transmembrane protein n=1 Tax=Halteria grandinella TaxID=5974 RepID=A0A8J8NUK3_HALGN|nr:hypothetical protein FGO68_gene7562 [Halteria grandinella]